MYPAHHTKRRARMPGAAFLQQEEENEKRSCCLLCRLDGRAAHFLTPYDDDYGWTTQVRASLGEPGP